MGKKQKCPEFENHERWLVSFADMMTLLFALFVVLFSLKEGAESPEIDAAAGSINESFNTIMEDIPVDRRVGPNEMGFGIFDHMRGDQVRPPLIKKFPGSTEQIKVIEDEMERVRTQLQNRLYGEQKFRDPNQQGFERIVSIHRDQDGFRVRLLATHFYDSGDYKIKQSARRELDEVAKIVKSIGRKVTVQGHTDSVPPSGRFTNWELSALRASDVVRYMIRMHGYAPTSINPAGFADTRPIASNATASGRSLNRRIELKIHYDD